VTIFSARKVLADAYLQLMLPSQRFLHPWAKSLTALETDVLDVNSTTASSNLTIAVSRKLHALSIASCNVPPSA